MTYRCILIDDESHFTELMEEYISEIPQLELVKVFHDPIRVIAEVTEKDRIDIVFLDIQMPQLSGIEIAPHLKKICRALVFVTSYSKYAVKAFDLDAADFLYKPFRLERLKQCIEKITRRPLQSTSLPENDVEEDFFYIKISGTQSKYIKFLYSEIIAFESDKNYIRIYTPDDHHRVYMGMQDVEKKLAGRSEFIRIHRSFIISKAYIAHVDVHTITMKKSRIRVLIGKQYRDSFLKYLENNRF